MSTPTVTRSGQAAHGTQCRPAAAGTTSPRAKFATTPIQGSPAGDSLLDPTIYDTAPRPSPSGRDHTSGSSHRVDDTQVAPAAAGTNFPADHGSDDTHGGPVGGEQDFSQQRGHGRDDTQSSSAPLLADPFLALAADILEDIEDNRKANENRLRSLTRTEEDSDGKDRSFGLDQTHPDVAQLAALVQMMLCDSQALKALGIPKPTKVRGVPCCLEHAAIANLEKRLRKHPLGPWIKAQKGIGDKQGARLLAVIGDPYVNMQTGEVRTVSQLWAYCGHGDPARRKRKGMTQADLFRLGNPVAKSRVWLIATSCVKQVGTQTGEGEASLATNSHITHASPSPYRLAYDQRKAANEGRAHTTDCVRCGPSGHPALTGTPWSDAHRHADALRITGKTILRDLWREAERIHQEQS